MSNKGQKEKPKIDQVQVKHVAQLARLGLTDEEIHKYGQQLENILNYVQELAEVKTDETEPTFQVTGLKNVTREDQVKPSLSQAEALSNAPVHKDGYFVVKKVFGD